MRYSTNKKLAFLIQVFYLAVWVLLAYLAWKAAGLIWPFWRRWCWLGASIRWFDFSTAR